MLRLLRIWDQLTTVVGMVKLTYEVVRLSSLGLNTNSFDRPPTVDGWVSYNDLISALHSTSDAYNSLQFEILDIANGASQLVRKDSK